MKTWSVGALLCISLLSHKTGMSATVHAQVNPSSATPSSEKKDIALMAPIDITEINLIEGNRFWFVPNPELDIITLGLCFTGKGVISDPAGKPGLSELLAAMLTEGGAGKLNRLALQKKLLMHNIIINAESTKDDLVINLRTPTKNLKVAIQLLKSILTGPLFDEAAFALTRNKIKASLQQSLHSPMDVAKAKLTKHMYGLDHPYAQSPEMKLAAIDQLTTKDLKAHFKTAITSAGVNAAGSGNGEATTLAAFLSDVLTALPKGKKETPNRDGTLLCNGKVIDENMTIAQTIVLFTHPSLDREHPDFVASFLLVSALGGTPFESRLWREIREKRGLSYGVSLDNPVSALKYGMIGYFATTPSSVDQAIQLVRETWATTMKDGITQAELDLQKQYLMGSYPLTFNISKDLVKALLSYQSAGYDKNYPAERNARINAVTLDDVNRVAKTLLQPDKLGFVVILALKVQMPSQRSLPAPQQHNSPQQ